MQEPLIFLKVIGTDLFALIKTTIAKSNKWWNPSQWFTGVLSIQALSAGLATKAWSDIQFKNHWLGVRTSSELYPGEVNQAPQFYTSIHKWKHNNWTLALTTCRHPYIRSRDWWVTISRFEAILLRLERWQLKENHMVDSHPGTWDRYLYLHTCR